MARIPSPTDDPTTPGRDEPLVPSFERPRSGEARTLVPPPPRTVAALAMALVLIAAVAALLLTALRADRAEEAPVRASGPPAAQAPAPPAGGESEEDPPAPAEEGIHAVLEVSVRSWVEATVDGDPAVEEVLEEGRRVELEASERLELMLGNAGGIRLEINGEDIPTGEPGEVVQLSFAWEDGQLVRD